MTGVKAYDRGSYLQDVKTLRDRHPDWTQARIARELGISRSTLTRILSGK